MANGLRVNLENVRLRGVGGGLARGGGVFGGRGMRLPEGLPLRGEVVAGLGLRLRWLLLLLLAVVFVLLLLLLLAVVLVLLLLLLLVVV